MTFKIKLEDKAAFLNRMEKQGEAIDSKDIKNNKLEGYFEVTINNPKQEQMAKNILKQSPKINTVKEMKKGLTKSGLKERVRQELQSVIAEKKKMKGEDKKEKIDEALSPEMMDAIQAIGGFSSLVATAFGIVKAGTMAAKKEIVAKLKAKGEDIPDDKTLDKLATQAFKGAMDRATGAGMGASTPDVKI